jgi:outer membrane receptor for ferrienterochelin and colicins
MRRSLLSASLLVSFLSVRSEAQEPDSAGINPLGMDVEEDSSELSLEERLSIQVVTASQQEESLEEAPVPITVVTSDMIRAIGARNLQDVLTTYVPGMTFVVDHNEVNVAMRGIYASSQQKILVLLDGHRLNGRAYSMAAPDYSIGLDFDKVKQIEILRGPGSSLYGNVALMAVVNIVTKKGAELSGITARIGGADFISREDTHPLKTDGEYFAAGRSASLTAGTAFGSDHDVLLWASTFSAPGQRVPIAAASDYSPVPKDGEAIVGGFMDPASYDVGIRYRAGNFSLLGAHRLGHLVESFTGGGSPTGEVYDYDRYRPFQGIKPGLGHRSSHLEAKYRGPLADEFTIELTAYYDRNDIIGAISSDPTLGRSIFLNWNDDAIGAIAQGYLDYSLLGSGTLLTGFQVDAMRVLDSGAPTTDNFDWARYGDTNDKRVILLGGETIYSPFFQLKHKFSNEWIANIGVRYDVKDRFKGENLTALSPRIALVYAPSQTLNFKLSYAESFVDAPYWYRYNNLAAYQGSENLTPERLRSIQGTWGLSLFDGRLNNYVNLFYDDVFDFIFRDNNPGPNEPVYQNAGALKSIGIEDEAAWVADDYSIRLNLTLQREIEHKDFGAEGGEIFNVPTFVANMIFDVNPFPSLSEKLWANFSLRYTSSQRSPISPTFRLENGVVAPFQDPEFRVDGYFLVGIGVRALDVFVPGLSLDARVSNLFDTRYMQGGSVIHPYPQPGRTIMALLTYHFSAGKEAP